VPENTKDLCAEVKKRYGKPLPPLIFYTCVFKGKDPEECVLLLVKRKNNILKSTIQSTYREKRKDAASDDCAEERVQKKKKKILERLIRTSRR
jgi:hypothetical protein